MFPFTNRKRHTRNSGLRTSSPVLRITDDRPTVPAAVPLLPPTSAPAAFALFAAAAARKRLAPLGRFMRVIAPVPLPGAIIISIAIGRPISSSRSTRRRNGLGRFSSSCRSYNGAVSCEESAPSPRVTVRVSPDEEDDDDDDDDEEDEEAALVVVIVRSSSSAASVPGASLRPTWDRAEIDGRRRRVVRRAGGAGAEREGTSAAVT